MNIIDYYNDLKKTNIVYNQAKEFLYWGTEQNSILKWNNINIDLINNKKEDEK